MQGSPSGVLSTTQKAGGGGGGNREDKGERNGFPGAGNGRAFNVQFQTSHVYEKGGEGDERGADRPTKTRGTGAENSTPPAGVARAGVVDCCMALNRDLFFWEGRGGRMAWRSGLRACSSARPDQERRRRAALQGLFVPCWKNVQRAVIPVMDACMPTVPVSETYADLRKTRETLGVLFWPPSTFGMSVFRTLNGEGRHQQDRHPLTASICLFNRGRRPCRRHRRTGVGSRCFPESGCSRAAG